MVAIAIRHLERWIEHVRDWPNDRVQCVSERHGQVPWERVAFLKHRLWSKVCCGGYTIYLNFKKVKYIYI